MFSRCFDRIYWNSWTMTSIAFGHCSHLAWNYRRLYVFPCIRYFLLTSSAAYLQHELGAAFGQVERALDSLRNIADKERSMGPPGSGSPGFVFIQTTMVRSVKTWVGFPQRMVIHPLTGILTAIIWILMDEWMTINHSPQTLAYMYIYIITYNIHIYIS